MPAASALSALRRIRVTHLIAGLELGGAESTLAQLVGRFDSSSFDSEVVSLTTAGVLGRVIEDAGVPVYALGMRRGRPPLAGIARLVAHLRRRRPDVLQTWMYHADLIGLAASRLSRPKALLWNIRSADMEMSRYGALSAWTFGMCARFSALPDGIVVNSAAGLRHHEREGFAPQAWHLIPNGVDVTRFHPSAVSRASVLQELGWPADSIVIGMFARLDPMKDHHSFFRAAGELSTKFPKARFLLAGSGITFDEPSLASAVTAAGLQGRVALLGPRRDMPRLSAALDVAVLSSLSEAFPNVVAEAMACAVPVVTADVGDAARIVGTTGRVVPKRDPAALAAAIGALIAAGEEARRTLGAAARLRVEQEFSLDAAVARYAALYRASVEGGAVASEVGSGGHVGDVRYPFGGV